MIKKLLIANRGEVAVRIIRAARALDIRTVAIYSRLDANSMHTFLADEAYCIGGATPTESYMNMSAIITCALKCGCDAIHPGYGFLSENAEFAELCEKYNIIYVGARCEILRLLADRRYMADKMAEAGIPSSPDKLWGKAKQIDVQLVCDKFGSIVVLGDRDSSYVFGESRMLAEAPAYGITEKIRQRLHKGAKTAAELLSFCGVGTAVFNVDGDGDYAFDKFVPRLQIGTAVTEEQSRIDIVNWQIRVAGGEALGFSQSSLKRFGHSIGCRVFAVNTKQFTPSSGTVDVLHIPGGMGVRFDSAVHIGSSLCGYYEPMIGKMIAYSRTRNGAVAKLKGALSELVTGSMSNNGDQYIEILSSDEFLSGEYNKGSYLRYLRSKGFSLNIEDR